MVGQHILVEYIIEKWINHLISVASVEPEAGKATWRRGQNDVHGHHGAQGLHLQSGPNGMVQEIQYRKNYKP